MITKLIFIETNEGDIAYRLWSADWRSYDWLVFYSDEMYNQAVRPIWVHETDVINFWEEELDMTKEELESLKENT